jgi:superfamily II DNA or RNA helicase
MNGELRPYQNDLLGQMYPAIEAREHVVVMLPTGGGKTRIASTIIRWMREASKRALFIVPAIELIDQTVEQFYAEGIRDIGVIQADHPLTNWSRPVQVASVQTLSRRRNLPAVDVVFIDEAHRWYRVYNEWLARPWKELPVIGLSATPGTRGLGKRFRKLIVGGTTATLIQTGYLSKFRVYAPASPDLRKVRTVAGDYHEGDLANAMNKSDLVADVVNTWTIRAKGRPTLLFAVDRAHAKHLQQKFIEAGVIAEYVDAFTPKKERSVLRDRFRKGEIEVLCNVGVLTTGVDWVNIACIVLARPTKSVMLFVQMVGRGLRIAVGKADCLILDHSDNHVRLGFVTDIAFDRLDDGTPKPKPERRAPLPKPCPRCKFLKPPKTWVCPACGFAPKPKCDVMIRDGELVEFTSRRNAHPEDGRVFFAELRAIAEQRGYKQGWAAHHYKTKFGSFPPWAWNGQPTCKPSVKTESWVRSRQIAYAKARERAMS